MDWFKILAVAAAIMTLFMGFSSFMQPASIVTIGVEHDVTKTNIIGNDYYYTSLVITPLISEPEGTLHLTTDTIMLSTTIKTTDKGLITGFVRPTNWAIKGIVITRTISIMAGDRDGEVLDTSNNYMLSDILTMQSQVIKSSYQEVDLSEFDLDETTPALEISTALKFDAHSSETDSAINDEYVRHSHIRVTIMPPVNETTPIEEPPDEPDDDTASIYGYVNTPGGIKLDGALVTIGSLTDITDSTGSYVITGITPGDYMITISKSGYEDGTRTVTIYPNSADQFNLIIGETSTVTTPDDEYQWTDYGYMAVLGGILLAAVVFAVVPLPKKIKGFVAIAVALAGLVLAHLFNTGGI